MHMRLVPDKLKICKSVPHHKQFTEVFYHKVTHYTVLVMLQGVVIPIRINS